ncbi:hypothetical protein FZC79_10345 [Rossellomorea vietnamensis]|uniref:Uncharacterized protein n=1 Tax=Rossellomorea vietnamensis TaxID=218284 RepID=A0A5D4KDY3_9BACI|nr:hypothetical protein [Rossellomorea vietnamensis]TYR75561.1 hypothetical protein FZC79_10345 [Rossellomorea vietnamensis]
MNSNFEINGIHEATERSISRLEKVMRKQDIYGYEKYGKALSSDMPYSWMDMFMEEMADGLKYLEMEQERKQEVVRLLKMALISEHSKTLVSQAIHLLEMGGTAK